LESIVSVVENTYFDDFAHYYELFKALGTHKYGQTQFELIKRSVAKGVSAKKAAKTKAKLVKFSQLRKWAAPVNRDHSKMVDDIVKGSKQAYMT
jgi:hypothetical protein